MVDLSVVISAFNEELAIERCLKSVRWAGEIIVIDNSSADETANIAKKYTSKIYRRPNHLMLNTNKNFGFEKATKKWILSLDADEEVSELLASEIRKVINNTLNDQTETVGYWIQRKNIIFGRWIQHGLWWPDKQLRLFQRGSGKFPCKHIHEYIQVDGPTGQLAEPYMHYNYESVHQYLTTIDRASTSEVLSLAEMNYQVMWYDAIRFPMSDFLKIYFAQGAYKDGLHGLVLALFQSFYSFCTFAKAWERTGFRATQIPTTLLSREWHRTASEFRYWELTAKIDNSSNAITKLWNRIIRKYVI